MRETMREFKKLMEEIENNGTKQHRIAVLQKIREENGKTGNFMYSTLDNACLSMLGTKNYLPKEIKELGAYIINVYDIVIFKSEELIDTEIKLEVYQLLEREYNDLHELTNYKVLGVMYKKMN